MADTNYTIKAGDNLTKIATQFGSSVDALTKYNNITDPSKIQAGAIINIPGSNDSGTDPGTTPVPGSSSYAEDLTRQKEADANLASGKDINGKPVPGNPSQPAGTVAGTSDAARVALQAKEDALVAPTPFSATDTLNKLRSSQGLNTDESSLAANQTEQAQIQNDLNQFKQTSGAGMNEGGRLGQVSEKESAATYRLNQLNIEQTAITNRIATKNAYISQVLQAGEQDYTTAKASYDEAYKKASDAITSFNDNLETQKKDAMAGLTTITNLIKDNNIDPSTLSPALKTKIDELSLQAGIPAGTIEALTIAHPDAKILAPIETTNADGSKSVYFMTQDSKTGQPTLIKTIGLGGGTGSSASGGTYTDIAQEAINGGATPQQALDEAITVAQNRGITLTKAQQDSIYMAASKMKPITTSTADTTSATPDNQNQTMPNSNSPIYGKGSFSKEDMNSRISRLSTIFNGDKSQVKAQLLKDGYPVNEVNNRLGNIVDKAQQAGSQALNFFSKLFGQ